MKCSTPAAPPAETPSRDPPNTRREAIATDRLEHLRRDEPVFFKQPIDVRAAPDPPLNVGQETMQRPRTEGVQVFDASAALQVGDLLRRFGSIHAKLLTEPGALAFGCSVCDSSGVVYWIAIELPAWRASPGRFF
jgi:hypothetical protein